MTDHVLVIGGAGFIGANVADRMAQEGHRVVIFDNLARPGVMRNVRWLETRHKSRVELAAADVRDAEAVVRAVRGARHVLHFAAQAAVGLSSAAPREEFDINVGGTLNVLEAMQAVAPEASLLFASTHEVYGALGDVEMRDAGLRSEPVDFRLRVRGIGEEHALDFHSPHGAADRYVLDHARSFGLRAVVLRVSCVYGPQKLGSEDQGWVAQCFRCALRGEPLTLYGDGRHVRDLVDVSDLVDAIMLAQANIDRLRGRAFNIGGGPANTASQLEVIESIALLVGGQFGLERIHPRAGDQRWYVSDTTRFTRATGWSPRIGVAEGLQRLLESTSRPSWAFANPIFV